MSQGAAAMPPAAAARIKGAGIQPFLTWYAGRWGRDRLLAAARGLPPDLAGVFDLADPVLGVLPSQWFPARAIHGLLNGLMDAHTPEERLRISREGATAVIESTLKGVYRWLFERMMTPDRYGRSAQRLFSRYYEPGNMVKLPLGEHGHLSVVTEWGGHHPLLCDFLIHTAEYVYGALGCRDLKIRRTACVSAGASDCRFEITWSG
jgi:hypothetical protein